MTGPEHYAEAQRLIKISNETLADFTKNTGAVAATAMAMMMWATAQAQVHATLALAAATAGSGDLVRWDDNQGPTDWHQVIYP